jgi:hypothetical protein
MANDALTHLYPGCSSLIMIQMAPPIDTKLFDISIQLELSLDACNFTLAPVGLEGEDIFT